MDYGKLLSRAWDTLRNNVFIVLLGVLAVLGGAGSGGSGQSGYIIQGKDFRWEDLPNFDFGGHFRGGQLPTPAAGIIVLLVLLIFLIALVFWVLGTIARGGMISAVDDLEESRSTDFMSAFQAGWERGWALLGIGLIPAIPALILLFFSVATLLAASGLDWNQGSRLLGEGWKAITPLLALACVLVPVAVVLSLLRTFANRACMLEGTGVLASYQRGFKVLGENLGSAVIIFLLQVAISIAVGVMMLIPGLLAAVCCLLWPILVLVQAAVVSFVSVLWTLAWREWVPGPEITA